MSKNHSAYVVITHIFQPENHNSPNRGKVNVKEQVEFVDRVKNRHLTSATAILDVINEKLVKNRAETASFTNYIDYLDEKYPKQMTTLYTMLGLKRTEDTPTDATTDNSTDSTDEVIDAAPSADEPASEESDTEK